MKTTFLIIPTVLLMLFMSSCFYEEAEPAHVEIYDTDEYETEELVSSYSDRYGTYNEYEYKAWIEVDLLNTGGITARNVSIEIVIFDGNREYFTIVHVSDIHPGEQTTINFDTGYSFIDEYDGYEVFAYWE